MRYRIRWAKRGKLRFVSHHDEALIFERSLRRAALPLSYSKGFTPHAKVAFGVGLPVGYGSEVELLDIELTEDIEPAEVASRFDDGLPVGLHVLGAWRLPVGAPSLGSIVDAADYAIASDAPWLKVALADFMERSEVPFVRRYKGADRTDDIRAGVLAAHPIDGGAMLRCALKPRSTRPGDVFSVLESMSDRTNTTARFQRTALLTKRGDGLVALTDDPASMAVAS